jgi:hypothetical protein
MPWHNTPPAYVLPALPLLCAVPETHQYIVLQHLKSKNALAAAAIDEAQEIERHPPTFQASGIMICEAGKRHASGNAQYSTRLAPGATFED